MKSHERRGRVIGKLIAMQEKVETCRQYAQAIPLVGLTAGEAESIAVLMREVRASCTDVCELVDDLWMPLIEG